MFIIDTFQVIKLQRLGAWPPNTGGQIGYFYRRFSRQLFFSYSSLRLKWSQLETLFLVFENWSNTQLMNEAGEKQIHVAAGQNSNLTFPSTISTPSLFPDIP